MVGPAIVSRTSCAIGPKRGKGGRRCAEHLMIVGNFPTDAIAAEGTARTSITRTSIVDATDITESKISCDSLVLLPKRPKNCVYYSAVGLCFNLGGMSLSCVPLLAKLSSKVSTLQSLYSLVV